MPPKRGRKPQSCKALAKAKSAECAVVFCSECKRMRAKAPCHRVRNPQGCGCDYCGPNTPTQPTSAPEVEVPLAPRQGRGTRRNSSIHEGRDATGNLLYGGVITDSTRKELKLQQQRNLERKHTRYWWMVLRGWLPKQLASQYPTTTTYKTTMVERSKHTRRWCMCTSMSL